MVSVRRPESDDERADAALRRSRHSRHHHLDRAILLSAAGLIYFWGSWWAVPFIFVYGVLYGSSSDSRWHECGARHRLSDRLDERTRLPDRQLHADAQSCHLAMEP